MSSVPTWQNLVTEGLLYAFVPLAVFTIYKCRGLRSVAVIATVPEAAYTFWCYFLAYMYVSGDWI